MKDQHVLAAQLSVDQARKESRPETGTFAPMGAALRRGVILEDNADGTYRVGIYGATNSVALAVENVPAWGGTFGAGDKVAVVFEPSRPIPWILGGGGSGGGGETFLVTVGELWYTS